MYRPTGLRGLMPQSDDEGERPCYSCVFDLLGMSPPRKGGHQNKERKDTAAHRSVYESRIAEQARKATEVAQAREAKEVTQAHEAKVVQAPAITQPTKRAEPKSHDRWSGLIAAANQGDSADTPAPEVAQEEEELGDLFEPSKQDVLTDDQIRQYYFYGCLHIPNFFKGEHLETIQFWADEVAAAPTAGDTTHEAAFGNEVVCRRENFADSHEG
jgi:hypothetical protein